MRFVGGAGLGQEYMDTQPPQQLVASPQGVKCGREEREGGGEWRGSVGEVLFPAPAGIAGQVGMFLYIVQLCLCEVVTKWLCPSGFDSHQL